MKHPVRPAKVLTAAQMGAVDRATIEAGIPGIVLMENAAHRCVEFLAERYGPLHAHRIVVVCGKGNNGGDGLAIARQLYTRHDPHDLKVVLIAEPSELRGDAALNFQMLHAVGLQEYRDFGPEMRSATLVIDAILGTGLSGAAKGPALDAIREINDSFPLAKVFAVDIPSGLAGDTGSIPGEFVRADATVTFTAPKVCHAVPPASHMMGEFVVAPIGSRPSLYEDDPAIQLALVTPASIASLFAARPKDSNKGKSGTSSWSPAPAGRPAPRSCPGWPRCGPERGWSPVACPESALDAVAAHAPEVMTEPLPEHGALDRVMQFAPQSRTLVAIGPGIGTSEETRDLVRRCLRT